MFAVILFVNVLNVIFQFTIYVAHLNAPSIELSKSILRRQAFTYNDGLEAHVWR